MAGENVFKRLMARKKKQDDRTITEDEAREFVKEAAESLRESRDNVAKDLQSLRGIADACKRKDTIPDEMVIHLHNLLAIAPDERFAFRDLIIQLFAALPAEVKKSQDVSYLIDRLGTLQKEDTEQTMQPTDYAMYWSAFRRALYVHGLWDTNKMVKLQNRIKYRMLTVCNVHINRRESGLKTADYIIRKQEEAQNTLK